MISSATLPGNDIGAARARFFADVEPVQSQIVLLGAHAQSLVRDAVDAFIRQDTALGRTVVERDDDLDKWERNAEIQALHLFSQHQPVASDLRRIGSILRILADIERVGDQAVNLVTLMQRMQATGVAYTDLVDLPRFGHIATTMVHRVTAAFQAGDSGLAESVISMDDEADIFYKESQRDLRQTMRADAETVLPGSFLLFATHHLERVCDHCTNIAERIVYIATGRAADGAHLS